MPKKSALYAYDKWNVTRVEILNAIQNESHPFKTCHFPVNGAAIDIIPMIAGRRSRTILGAEEL